METIIEYIHKIPPLAFTIANTLLIIWLAVKQKRICEHLEEIDERLDNLEHKN